MVAFGGSDKRRLVTACALAQARSRSPLVNGFVDDSLWNAGPSLNEASLEVSCVTHCSLINSFLYETPDRVHVWAVWQPQVWCNELGCLLLQ